LGTGKQLCVAVRDALRPATRCCLTFSRFEQRRPAAQNAVDLFEGRWATLGAVSGVAAPSRFNLFEPDNDPRPALAGRALGNAAGRFDGMRVLELGPLEGAHAYQLERLGAASVLAVEANAEHFLKCLVVKEILGLGRSRFMLGDALAFLEGTDERFDVVFCAGILYHVKDPVRLIELLGRVTDKVFIYTHYHDPVRAAVPLRRVPEVVTRHGTTVTYYRHSNRELSRLPIFFGGNRRTSAWMERDAILAWFERFGYETTVLSEDRSHRDGSNFCFAARRAAPGADAKDTAGRP
jgi:SAM-dependent methyltransferase